MKAIYIRKSVLKQSADSVSAEMQIDLCKQKLGVTKDEDVIIFDDDLGKSGKNIDQRPGLQRLLMMVKARYIDTVCVYRIDRLGRSVSDFYQIYDILDTKNCTLISATESIDTSTPNGRLMINMLVGFAQNERESTSERVKASYIRRTQQGRWLGGTPPFGYRPDKDADGHSTLPR